jgi:hypothetical protein
MSTDLSKRRRCLKVTSPMSVGTWILGGCGTALGMARGCEALGVLPRVKLTAQTAAGLLGAPLTTYTAALVANTPVPVWHEARRELPFVFAGSAAASSGAAAAITTSPNDATAARRLAVAGALLELGATKAMEGRLGQLVGEPYGQGAAGRFTRLAKGCTTAGAALVALAGRRRSASALGGGLLLAGSLFERLAVYGAGSQSAADPKHTVVPQRERAARTGSKATTHPSAN